MGVLDRILAVFGKRSTEAAASGAAEAPQAEGRAETASAPASAKSKKTPRREARPKKKKPSTAEKRSKKARKVAAVEPAAPPKGEVLSVEDAERRYGHLVRRPTVTPKSAGASTTDEAPPAPAKPAAPSPAPPDPAAEARRLAAAESRRRARLPQFETLISRTDALLAVEGASLRDLSSARRGLVDGWARLGEAPQPEAETLNARRDAVLAALDARIGIAQDSLEAVWLENLEQKRAIVEEASALAERAELKGAGPAMGALRAKLRATGPVAPADAEAIDAAYHAAEARLKARQTEHRAARDAAREEGLARLATLAQQAEGLAAAPDPEAAAEKIMTLQAAWKAIRVPGDTAEVWTRFRSACDAVFARRTQARHDASKEALDRFEQIVLQAEQLATDGVDGDPEREIEALMIAWKKVGRAPRDLQQTLWERLTKAFDNLRSPPTDLEGLDDGALRFNPFGVLSKADDSSSE